MCNYSDFVENRGRKEGRKEGKAEAIVNLMKNFKLGIEEALKGLSLCDTSIDARTNEVDDDINHLVGAFVNIMPCPLPGILMFFDKLS